MNGILVRAKHESGIRPVQGRNRIKPFLLIVCMSGDLIGSNGKVQPLPAGKRSHGP